VRTQLPEDARVTSDSTTVTSVTTDGVPVAGAPAGTASASGRRRFRRPLSLASRFMVANLVLLIVGGLLIGLWVGDQLQRGILARTAAITALYADSFIEPHVASLAEGDWLEPEDMAELDALLAGTSFGERIVALKIWSPEGVILYSPDRALIGQQFPIEEGLADALDGQVAADMSQLDAEENIAEATRFDHLLEMYVPVRERGSDRIIGVAEFYGLPDEIDREVTEARLGSWVVVAIAVALAFVVLYGIVRQGSDTIRRQESALRRQVGELSMLLSQNATLRDRVQVAANRSTTLNERALRRISSDLHDGPAQMLSLALLRLDALGDSPETDRERAAIEDALRDALRETRQIAAGLRLPELEQMTVRQVAERAVDAHVRHAGTRVDLDVGELPDRTPLAIRIALYRALQELLSNATRYGRGTPRARLGVAGGYLRLEIADDGPGFDASRVGEPGHLGLAGVREQAELLEGRFEVGRTEAGTTVVAVEWPVEGTAPE
jgi:signal transduction histidine kinase